MPPSPKLRERIEEIIKSLCCYPNGNACNCDYSTTADLLLTLLTDSRKELARELVGAVPEHNCPRCQGTGMIYPDKCEEGPCPDCSGDQKEPAHPDEMRVAAELAHTIWCHWMKHYFTLATPEEHYERWKNLMHKSFDELTEKERESDYRVSKELALSLHEAKAQGRREMREECKEAVRRDCPAAGVRCNCFNLPKSEYAEGNKNAPYLCGFCGAFSALSAIDQIKD